MAFPKISSFPETLPGPYERAMGRYIVRILDAFTGLLPDAESHACVRELVADPNRWSAGHAVFNEVRRRYLVAGDRHDHRSGWQYAFEESCCQAVYNATQPMDPFDPSSAFFVVAQALTVAKLSGVALDRIADVFARPAVE